MVSAEQRVIVFLVVFAAPLDTYCDKTNRQPDNKTPDLVEYRRSHSDYPAGRVRGVAARDLTSVTNTIQVLFFASSSHHTLDLYDYLGLP